MVCDLLRGTVVSVVTLEVVDIVAPSDLPDADWVAFMELALLLRLLLTLLTSLTFCRSSVDVADSFMIALVVMR